jgi:hypothetical protein
VKSTQKRKDPPVPVAKLPETEWGFYKDDVLPIWQLQFCANYELARSSEAVKKRVNDIRKDPKLARFPSLLRFLALRVPEFPKQPWLAIEDSRRIDLLAMLHITKNRFDHQAITDYGTPAEFMASLPLIHGKRPLLKCDLNAFAILELDFTESNDYLVEQFACWLKDKRKVLKEQFGEQTEKYKELTNRRGKNNYKAHFSGLLYRLGAFRYYQYYPMTKDNQGNGIKLYQDATSVSRNKKQIKFKIEEFGRCALSPLYRRFFPYQRRFNLHSHRPTSFYGF